jgi:ribose transport system substrate-binding protein
VAPVDEAAAAPGLKAWNEAGVPLVTYFAVDDSIKTDGICGSDNYGGGWLAGAWLADHLEGEGDVASIRFEFRQWHADQRNKGFEDAAKEGGLNVAVDGQALAQDEGEAVFENLLTANPDLKGGFAIWDGVGLGMAQAVSNLGRDDQVTVVTHDLTTGSAVPVRDGGVMKAAAVQYPKLVGENCAGIALKNLAGSDTSGIVALSEEELATQENVEQFHEELYGKSIDEALEE